MNILRKSFLLLLGLALCATMSAQQFYYEGIIFEVLTERPTAVRVFQVNRCMKSFEIPEKVTDYSGMEYDVIRIGYEGFRSACSLIDLHLGKVEIIEDGYKNYYEDGATDCHGGFYGCTDLSQVTMPHITAIGDYAFYKCPKLSQLIMGKQLQRIGKEAFVNCPSINSLQINAAQPPVCAPDAFMDKTYEQVVLRVPYGKKSIYQQTDVWKRFQHIEEMSESAGIGTAEGDAQRIRLRAIAGAIYLEGLRSGEFVCVYSPDGKLLNKQIAVDEKMQFKVEEGRTYLVKVGPHTFKVKI